jgi:glutamine synthetase
MCYTYAEESENPSSQCTRSLLKRVLDQTGRGLRKEFLVGSEIEFVLLDSSLQVRSTPDPIEGWSLTAGLRGEVLRLMEDIVESLAAAGIGVYHFHTEVAQQLEIALEPLPPMEAFDALYYAIETIKSFATAREMRATMTPKPLLNGLTNGMHLHLSMNPKEGCDHFLAGILQNLKPLCALGMANYDSYARVGDRMDNIGRWVSMGTENRDVPIRKISDSHWELRFVDATANYYLLLASVLCLGLAGIREKRDLTWSDIRIDPSSLDKNELARLGINDLLPRSLKEAIECLKEDYSIGDIIGREMKGLYIEMKEKDHIALDKMNDEERRKWFLKFF